MSERPLVAIFGLPNSGKTSLFNALSGSRAKVGNYPGITVERRIARVRFSDEVVADLLDIPGSYSLVSRSPEEQIAIEASLGIGDNPKPDVVITTVDATNPIRGLYIVLQLRELGVKVVVAQTMVDEAGDDAIAAADLARAIGYPVVSVDARRGRHLGPLREAVVTALSTEPPEPALPWQPSDDLLARIESVRPALPEAWRDLDAMALWALMSVETEDGLAHIPDELRMAVAEHHDAGEDIDEEVVSRRYRWLTERVAPLRERRPSHSLSDRIDRVLVHRVGGFVIFVVLMVILFQALFAWCDPLIGLIEIAFEWLGGALGDSLPDHMLTDLLVDGVVAGVGAVLVFLPQILVLFFFIGLLEDIGYMARVAVLMDRIMTLMNLNGRAFVPMLSGFACAIPAILATRTMERRRDRLLTMMVVPLMTCSARLPVYALIIAALFPPQSFFGVPVQGMLLVGMYLFSVVTALVAAWVMSRTVKPLKGIRLPLVVELPPYRLPRVRDVIRMMWERTAVFVREAGTVILVCTVALWFLLAFPRHEPAPAETEIEAAAAQIENSYAGRLGHAIEPAIAPLGYDWKIGIGIVGAFAAREVFVSTLGVVYAVETEADDDSSLRDQLRAERRPDGTRAYTPLVGLSLMIFFALACQCMSTLAVVKRETRSYRWPLFLFGYMTALAWVMSMLVYQGGRLFGLH